MSQMTSRQRMLTALTGGVPDRLPVTTHHVMLSFLEKYMGGVPYPEFFDHFGMDAWTWIVPYKPDAAKGEYFDPNQTFIHPLDYTHRVVSDNWRIETETIPDPEYRTVRYSFATPKGTLTMVLQGKQYTDWVIEPLIKDKRDTDLIAECVTHPQCDVEAVNRAAEAFGDAGGAHADLSASRKHSRTKRGAVNTLHRPEIIEIGVSVEEIEARRERVAKAKCFETPDRVPVIPAIAHRLLVPQVGVSFRDYYADPETMLRTQILAQKWLMENVRTDAHGITGAWTGAWTDFQNTFEAGSLGVEIHFADDDIPWVGAPWVKTDDDLKRLEGIDFVHSGINARQIAYRRAMMQVADKYPVRFQGGPVFYPGKNPALTHTSDGPFGVAGDVMGQTELFAGVYERPDFVQELLRIVVDKLIAWLDFCAEEEGLPTPRDLAWTDDLAVSLSAQTWHDILLSEERRLRFHFDGRLSLHMCGRSDHLLEIFRDELQIHELQGFGWQVSLDHVADVLAGRVVLLGNVNPMLIHQGTPDQVREATRTVIEKLAPYRGLIIQDGNNIPPGSPLENINAMMEAAEMYGRYTA